MGGGLFLIAYESSISVITSVRYETTIHSKYQRHYPLTLQGSVWT